jgi:hypothetical protein
VVSGLKSKVLATLTSVLPDSVVAAAHRKVAKPGSAG